jgi:AcrR family transcriptional regulator
MSFIGSPRKHVGASFQAPVDNSTRRAAAQGPGRRRLTAVGSITAMTTTPADPAPPKRKVGRPPRISRSMIATAANELGLEGLTLKDVADHLGVTVAALYHHVSSKDDLLRIAAEESTRAIALPVDRGQNWTQWLLEWANYNRAVFTAQPGLLGQYLEGGIPPEAMVHNLDTILSVLVRQGFSVEGANAAYELVSACALGSVVSSMWERSMRGEDGLVERYRRILDTTPRRQLPLVRRLFRSRARRPSFDERIEVVLRGIGAHNRVRWKPLVHATPR